jgi:hypothetical protein
MPIVNTNVNAGELNPVLMPIVKAQSCFLMPLHEPNGRSPRPVIKSNVYPMLKKATNGLLDLRITSGPAAMSAVRFVGCDVAYWHIASFATLALGWSLLANSGQTA